MERWTDDDGQDWVSCSVLCVGDYGVAGSVGEANIRALKKHMKDDDWIEQHGAYYSRQLWLSDTEDNREIVKSLEEDYPIFDEEEHSRVESEWEEEAWKDYGRSDLLATLPEWLQERAEALPEEVLWECYRSAMEATNSYPTMEYNGAYLPLERIETEWANQIRQKVGETMSRPVYAKLGSVSSGTMRSEDLIPAFIDALSDLVEELGLPGSTTEPAEETEARKSEVSRLTEILGQIERRMDAGDDGTNLIDTEYNYFESDEAQVDLEALVDELNSFAPPFAYFGASEGDGANYGFWLSMESVEEAVRDDEVLKLPAGDEWPEDELIDRAAANCAPEFILFVTDHGNCSLWEATTSQPKEPIWDVV